MRPTVDLRLGDCLGMLDGLPPFDVIITDPPYPDHYTDAWPTTSIEFLGRWPCRQLVFWSAKVELPLDYSAIHIWAKTGVGLASMYERIFERNGSGHYRVFRGTPVLNPVMATFGRDIYCDHPAQKPIGLMRQLVEEFCPYGGTVFDPFMGTGTTGVACVEMGRNFLGIELEERYYRMAEERLSSARLIKSMGPTWSEQSVRKALSRRLARFAKEHK